MDEIKGLKHDGDKLRWSLFPSGTLVEVLKVLEFGAKKYSPGNWMKLQDWRDRLYNAQMRHMEAWYNGEDNDPETGISHLAHAACNLLFLLWFVKNKRKKS